MFKYWSPMSVGAWGLLLFSGLAFLATLGALHEAGQIRWRLLRPLHAGVLGNLIAVLGGLCGFYLAGYTCALLSVTNRPLWADTTWLGLLFLLSGTSTAAALLMLLGLLRGARTRETIYWLCRMDRGTLILELLALIILTVSLGPALRTWMNVWGLVLLVGVVLAGILSPLSLEWRPRLLGRLSLPAGAVLACSAAFSCESWSFSLLKGCRRCGVEVAHWCCSCCSWDSVPAQAQRPAGHAEVALVAMGGIVMWW